MGGTPGTTTAIASPSAHTGWGSCPRTPRRSCGSAGATTCAAPGPGRRLTPSSATAERTQQAVVHGLLEWHGRSRPTAGAGPLTPAPCGGQLEHLGFVHMALQGTLGSGYRSTIKCVRPPALPKRPHQTSLEAGSGPLARLGFGRQDARQLSGHRSRSACSTTSVSAGWM
jgi:hypothetical protein